MVEVVPFRGWRYDLAQVGDLSDVVCPPYDVIDPALQDALYQRHPNNAVRLEWNRAEPDDVGPEDRYRRAAFCWKHWRIDNILQLEHEESIYAYDQEFSWEGETYVRRGFIARLRLEDFGTGAVFPHEETLSGPKADRLALFHATKANFSPIFGLYSDESGDVQQPLSEYCITRTAHLATDHLGVKHRFWQIPEVRVINAVRELMRDKSVYIADGHHRYTTSLNYRRERAAAGALQGELDPANFVMAHFVSMQDAGLQVLPTHRLVSGLPMVTTQELRTALAANFQLEFMGVGNQGARDTWDMITADGSQRAFGFGSAADGGWLFGQLIDDSAMIQLAPQHSDDWRDLAVSRLHELVLGRLLPERFPSSQPRCQYVHRLEEVLAGLKSAEFQLGCLIPPATVDHVALIASNRETMPPKSTYFYPKLLTGLVFHGLE